MMSSVFWEMPFVICSKQKYDQENVLGVPQCSIALECRVGEHMKKCLLKCLPHPTPECAYFRHAENLSLYLKDRYK